VIHIGREGGRKAAARRVRREFLIFLCVEYCVPLNPNKRGKKEDRKPYKQTRKKGFLHISRRIFQCLFSVRYGHAFPKHVALFSCSLRGINPGASAPFKELHIMPAFKPKNTGGSNRNQACPGFLAFFLSFFYVIGDSSLTPTNTTIVNEGVLSCLVLFLSSAPSGRAFSGACRSRPTYSDHNLPYTHTPAHDQAQSIQSPQWTKSGRRGMHCHLGPSLRPLS